MEQLVERRFFRWCAERDCRVCYIRKVRLSLKRWIVCDVTSFCSAQIIWVKSTDLMDSWASWCAIHQCNEQKEKRRNENDLNRKLLSGWRVVVLQFCVDRMANRPVELENQNLSNQETTNSGSNSDIAAETTLFEQIAVQIHRYRGNFLYFQRLPGILNLLEVVSKLILVDHRLVTIHLKWLTNPTTHFVQCFGLLTFALILVACNNYYDPWLGIVVTGMINRFSRLNLDRQRLFLHPNQCSLDLISNLSPR